MILLLACVSEPDDTEMSAVRLLSRTSLDLRGVRPTEAEIEAVETDPAALDGLVDSFLDDDRFPERLEIGRAHV